MEAPDEIWITVTNMGDGHEPCTSGPWTRQEAEERVGQWTRAVRYVRPLERGPELEPLSELAERTLRDAESGGRIGDPGVPVEWVEWDMFVRIVERVRLLSFWRGYNVGRHDDIAALKGESTDERMS